MNAMSATSLIITNARVHTMDDTRPVSEAVAIADDQIAAVGSRVEINRLAGTGCRVIDAEGRLLLPGFNDAHVHFLQGGFQLSSVDLRGVRNREEFVARVGQFAEKLPPEEWISGGGWNNEAWDDPALPDKDWIDEACGGRPAFLERSDCHTVLVNSAALKLAGISLCTADPAGGEIVRGLHQRAHPTGILKDAAIALVERIKPAPSFGQKLAAARAASQHAASLGVTSVQDMSADDDLPVYEDLISRGELLTRVYGMWPLPRWEELEKRGICLKSPMLRNGGLKGFSDGSLGSGTALFFEAYTDRPDYRGLWAPEMFPKSRMTARVICADHAGLHIAIHAIGDRANHSMLTLLEHLPKVNGLRERRHRIEHAQHLRPRDVPRFSQAGIIASMQPYHLADDGCWAEKRLGAERCRLAYAFRSLLDAGATLAFGSDWPVAPLDPIPGIAAAVTRQTLDARNPNGWFPEQRITVEETIRAYTVGAAYAEFQESVKGTIAPGKLADLVLLDRDLFAIPPAEIAAAKIDLTIMGGRVVFER